MRGECFLSFRIWLNENVPCGARGAASFFCLALSFLSFFLSFCLIRIKLIGQPKPVEAEAVSRIAANSAISRTAVILIVVVTAPAKHAAVAGGRTRRIGLRR